MMVVDQMKEFEMTALIINNRTRRLMEVVEGSIDQIAQLLVDEALTDDQLVAINDETGIWVATWSEGVLTINR